MKFATVQFPGDKGYLLPIGDIHFGDKAFGRRGKQKLLGNLNWLTDNAEHARGFLMGDLFNIAGRDTKTSPWENDPEEVLVAEEFFKPYAHLFVGAIRGNHERRLVDKFGFDPLKLFCSHLNIPYMGVMAVLKIQVGLRPESHWYWNTYFVCLHHSTGGGGTLGNAVNRAKKLEDIVQGCDAFCVGHNHNLGTAVKTIFTATPSGIDERKVTYVSCGSYLDYQGSYAEEAMYAPSKLGSPRLRFDGTRNGHDLHVSL